MTMSNPWNAYRRIATQTASPGQLVLMLYEGAIRFLERALDGFELDDPAESVTAIHNNIMRAQDIIAELNFSLNMGEGGKVAANFRRLYDYLDRRLLESNLKKEPEGIRDVIRRLTVIRDAWSSMLSGQAGYDQPPAANGRSAPATPALAAA
jgi:flagellar protein FliS